MRVKRSRGGGRGSGYVGPPPLHPPGKYEFIKIHIIKLSKICNMPHPPPLIFFLDLYMQYNNFGFCYIKSLKSNNLKLTL